MRNFQFVFREIRIQFFFDNFAKLVFLNREEYSSKKLQKIFTTFLSKL